MTILAAVGYLVGVDAADEPMLGPPRDYRAQLFHVTNGPQDPFGDRFPGLDGLLQLMGSQGLKICRSSTVSVCENIQFTRADGFDRPLNNARSTSTAR